MKSFLLLLTLIIVANGRAQDVPFALTGAESEAEFHGYSEYVETLERLRARPIKLKRAKPSELLVLPGVTPRLATAIVDYARNNDPYSIREIADSLNLSPELELVLNYCATISGEPPQSLNVNIRSRGYAAAARSRGYLEKVFAGSPLESYQRLNAVYDKFELTGSWAKDAGETIERSSGTGGLLWRSESFSAALGDYSLAFGLGTLLGRAFPSVKGPEVIAPAIAYFSETKPNSSSYFSKKLRGGSAEYVSEESGFDLKIFYSDQFRAGSYDSASGVITSLYSSGLYRSAGEAAKIDAVRERLAGAQSEIDFGTLSLGAAAYLIDYSKEVKTESKGNFLGRRGALSSIFAALSLEKATLAAEATLDARGSCALVVAGESALGELELSGRARYFPAEFRSPLGSAFGESSTPANEGGVYVAARYQLSDSVRLSAYADLFATPGRTYYVSKPVRGADLFFQSDFKLIRLAALSLRARFETQNDEAEIDNSRIGFQRTRLSFRADARKTLRGICDARIVVDLRRIYFSGTLRAQSGAAAYIELTKKFGSWMEATARATLFSTDGYDSAIWQYESLLPGYFSIPALYERGSRFSAKIRLTPFDWMYITAAYSGLSKNYRETLGSGWDELPQNYSRTLYFQIDARY